MLKIHYRLHLIKLIYVFLHAITTWVAELPDSGVCFAGSQDLLHAEDLVVGKLSCYCHSGGAPLRSQPLEGGLLGAGVQATLGCRVRACLQMSNYKSKHAHKDPQQMARETSFMS